MPLMVLPRNFLTNSYSWLYVAEILPAVWMGYSVASSWIFSIIIAMASPYSIDLLGRWTFFIFFVFTAFSGSFFWGVTTETQNKTIEQIRKDYETKGSRARSKRKDGLGDGLKDGLVDDDPNLDKQLGKVSSPN